MNTITVADQFLKEVMDGLKAAPKRLSSKYFYDATGDRIFQQIMHCPEYYLTRSEEGLLIQNADKIISMLVAGGAAFDLVELGAGDASKSMYLLRAAMNAHAECTYYPIDISESVIQQLETRLPALLPGLELVGLNGEYLPMLEACYAQSDRRKALLFMGGNIGNMETREAVAFCEVLYAQMRAGDSLIIGFDLKKSPFKILAAYNDQGGLTRDFNLNLLQRINTELNADFDLGTFEHYPSYDPLTGRCTSFLVSNKKQEVHIAAADQTISFEDGEVIHTEISQKYDLDQVNALARKTGFQLMQHLIDPEQQFVITIWAK